MSRGATVPEVRLTITIPQGPSTLAASIRSRHPEMVETVDVFRHVALQARNRLVFVVPFFDLHGALLLVQLFQETPARDRVLICRSVDDLRSLNASIDVKLAEHGVQVRGYKVVHLRDNGTASTETFHAKIALADATCAYVGSANAMRSSLETTMECGFLVRGSAVGQVKDLVDVLLENA